VSYDIRVTCADMSATLYVRAIYDTKTGYVWRPATSSWVAWNNAAFVANPAIYSIALAPLGGGLFVAPMPVGILAGTEIYYIACIQAGAAPAADDLIQARDSFRWSGTIVATSTGVADNCWVSLAEVQALPGIPVTMDSSTLAMVINGVCSGIERHCKRRFRSQHYKQWIRGRGSRTLWLENRPISVVDRVSVGKLAVGWVIYNHSMWTHSSASVRISPSSTVGGVYAPTAQKMTCRSVYQGVTTSFDLLFSNYATLGSLFAAMEGHAGWEFQSVATFDDYPTADLYPHEHRQCRDYACYQWIPNDTISEYKVEGNAGLITLERGWFPNSIANVWPELGRPPRGLSIDNVFPERGWFSLAVTDVFVEYDGGYSDEEFPADLKAITMSLIRRMIGSIDHDPSIVSHRLGDEAWTKRGSIMVDEALWQTYQKALQSYRSPTV